MRRGCSECQGSRHRWVGGRWVACRCLLEERRQLRYRKAGVPPRFDDETWRTFAAAYEVPRLKLLAGVAKTLQSGEQPEEWLLVHGRPTRARTLAMALLMRAACDGGLQAMAVDLPGLIDVEFEKGRGQEIYRHDVLAIECGREPPNKWNRVVVEKAIRQRWADKRFLVLVVHGDPSGLASRYRSALLEDALGEKFKRVRVKEREG